MQDDGQAQRVLGRKNNGSCVCAVTSNMWSFPAVKYEAVQQQVLSCEGSLIDLQEQVRTNVNQHYFTVLTVVFISDWVHSSPISPLI